MAKIYGLFGSMTGKLADVVMSVRNGEQVARKYQPIVANPSTSAQIASRAKLKLMSQLSAIMAPVIAMPRQGVVSSRNLFVKANYKHSSYGNDTANVNLLAVQLTKSVVDMSGIVITGRTEAGQISVRTGANPSLSRVVYVALEKGSNDSLVYRGSAVADPGADFTFQTTIGVVPTNEAIIYAYGVRDNTDAARVAFGDLVSPTAEDVAKLIVSRTLTEADVTLTKTYAVTSPIPE